MVRLLAATLLAFYLASLTVRAEDRVTFFDRAQKKEVDLTGTIQSESPGKIVLKTTSTATREVPAGDVIEVVYDIPPRLRPDYSAARNDERKLDTPGKDDERKKGADEAAKGYQKLLKDLPADKYKLANRHLQYKLARLTARLAEDDPAQLNAAIASLAKFRKDHADGWQVVPCARLLARLQTDKGEFDAALKTYTDLAALPDVGKETKQESELQIARALVRGKKYADAEKRLQDILKAVPADDPQALRARIHLAEAQAAAGKLDDAVKQLEDLIAKTTDPELKALAYNTLGDCYRTHNKPKDALWPYLYVDVLYHQDRREHARALEQLAKLFEELGDTARAKQYKEKLKGGAK